MVLVTLVDSFSVPGAGIPNTLKLDASTTGNTTIMSSGQFTTFTDDDLGTGNNYSSNTSYDHVFETSSGLSLQFVNFQFETYNSSQYDRLGIMTSSTGLANSYQNVSEPWMQTSYDTVCPWKSGFGGSSYSSAASSPGWIFPGLVSRGLALYTQNTGVTVSSIPVMNIASPYVKFCFISDGSSTDVGWEINVTAV